jgi:hypothetical protein
MPVLGLLKKYQIQLPMIKFYPINSSIGESWWQDEETIGDRQFKDVMDSLAIILNSYMFTIKGS